MIRIRLLGSMSLEQAGRPLAVSPRERALFALLLTRWPRQVSRGRIIDLLWPEQAEESGQQCLSTTLWRLRTALAGVAGLTLQAPRSGDVGLTLPGDAEVDILLFQTAVVDVLKAAMGRRPARLLPEEAGGVERGLALYQGELLEGFDGEWALYERRRLHEAYLDGMRLLGAHFFETGRLDRAVTCFQEILRWDPLREDIHRELMAVRHGQGRRAQAADQFQTCRASLRAELGLDAARETRRLLSRILETERTTPGEAAAAPDLGHALARMHEALQAASGACDWMMSALSRPGPEPAALSPLRPAQGPDWPEPGC